MNLEHKLKYSKTREQERYRLKILNALAVSLMRIADRQELAWYVVREVVGELGFIDCVMYYFSPERNSIHQVAAIGAKNPDIDEIVSRLEIPLGEGITGTVALNRRPMIVNDLKDDPLYIPDIEPARSEICVPLIDGERLYGVIDSEHPDPGFFNEEHLEILTTVAAMVSAKLLLIEQGKNLALLSELQTAKDRFRDFVDTASDWYWELNDNLRYTYFSPKKDYGEHFSHDQFLGKLRAEVKPDDIDETVWRRHMSDLAARRPFRNFVQSWKVGGGEKRWQTLSGKPWFDAEGKFRGYRGTGTDITHQVQLDAELKSLNEALAERVEIQTRKLRESERTIRLVIDSVPAMIANVGADERYRYVNKPYADLFGRQPEQVMGKSILSVIGRELYDRTARHRGATLSGKAQHFEESLPAPDGASLNYQVAFIPQFDEGGTVRSYISMIQDITARKREEEVVRRHNEELEDRVRERTAELEESRNEAEAANVLKSHLITTMSHELRTPLTSIVAALKLVTGGSVGPLSDDARELLGIAARNSDQLTLLVNDILDVEQLNSGAMELQMDQIELGSVVREAVKLCSGYAEDHDVRFRIDDDLPVVPVQGDKRRLHQVMANLLSNAAKFSPVGADVRIDVIFQDNTATVSISDRGAGIPDSIRDKVFDKFIRSDNVDTRNTGGVGLGLNIAQSIVELHGGAIGFDSETDVGTTFFFTLPTI